MSTNGYHAESPPPTTGRSLEVELSSEVISIELDNLDPNPQDMIDLLREGRCKGWVWTTLAAEYWRKGYLDGAQKIGEMARESSQNDSQFIGAHLVFALLANLQIARAYKAPKLILQSARQDILHTEKPREDHYTDATSLFNLGERKAADAGDAGNILSLLTRGILQLNKRDMDEARRSFDAVLSLKPTNLVALLGKAKILYATRQYPQALKLFQRVLQLNPQCLPDPRIGIGLCLWAMGQKEKAKAAWQRSLEVNPSEWPSQLLLGIEALNSSKNENQSEEERLNQFLLGTRLVERAFKANQTNAAAANVLCELTIQKGQYKRAEKLAERVIQFADTKMLLSEGYIRAARIAHAEGSTADAMKYYTKAKEGPPPNVVASVGIAQMQLKNDEIPAAIHTLDTLLQQPGGERSAEATAMLASLRAYPRPGVSSADQAQEKQRARELLDRVCRMLHLPEDSHAQAANGTSVPLTRSQRKVAQDVDLHIEIAKLWRGENSDRMERAYQEAARLSEAGGKADPRIVNNLAALKHLEGDASQARLLYEKAITHASTLDPTVAEGMSTSILYNLARAYEDQGEDVMAKEAYEKLLNRHPEYVDAKLRQARMLADQNRKDEAHELVKQALVSQKSDLNIRAFYTHFLIQSGTPKLAKDFVFSTLKDHDKHDIYALCAAGWIQYHQARESRDSSPTGVQERKRGFQRSAEFYEKALHLDPMCAVAAQGLAIVTAEDALGNLGGSLGPIGPDEAQKRIKDARDALDIFAKVRESINDGSVYANMGHCYYGRDEFDRAIESYETASRRFYNNQDVPVLLYLCRSWYAKANKDQSFSAMTTSLQYAQRAYHLHPWDKAILYNIAMIQQKAAEMLLSVPPAKRSLKDLERAIEQAGHAQKLFASLAADESPMTPYSREIADQRRKYGDSMLRRCDEHLAAQRQWEAEAQAKLETARQRRQEEKERQEAAERERQEQLRVQAEKLAEERRRAREQALEWTRDMRVESDEERERRSRKAQTRKPRGGDGSADEGDRDREREPKKKRRGKLKRGAEERNDEEDDALFSDNEEAEGKPAKKRAKKRAVADDEEEGEVSAPPRKKQIKSKEYISDSDEEMS
ncbi:RNA polymerase II-associated protein [Obba rivulosa]|uniref:RNA polymerase II-associated protein n=1 Tax=Obba rivulosa TaxID=1052685 RepID=A0A8E2APQ8_9APHY|nr:RNA polymerase II-associated protein [Obba rivulosa]